MPVNKAGIFRPDVFGKVGQKCDDVVLGDGLNLVNAVTSNSTSLAFRQRLRFFRNDTQFGLCVAGVGLNLVQMRNFVAGSQMAVISGRE